MLVYRAFIELADFEMSKSSVKNKRIKAISIRVSQKPLGFSKNALTKSFLEFYLVYNRFCLKRVR